MKINSLYTLLINRFKINEKLQSPPGERARSLKPARGDRAELSRLVAALKEMEHEGRPDPAHAARLSQLKEKIDSGSYTIDTFELAAAMLKIPDGQ